MKKVGLIELAPGHICTDEHPARTRESDYGNTAAG